MLGVKPEMHMMYASSKVHLVQKLDVSGKVIFFLFSFLCLFCENNGIKSRFSMFVQQKKWIKLGWKINCHFSNNF